MAKTAMQTAIATPIRVAARGNAWAWRRWLDIRKTLGDAKLGRAGSWVTLDFRFRRADGAGRDQAKEMVGIAARRGPFRAVDPLGGAVAKVVFHDSILEAVERNDSEASARRQLRGHRIQPRGKHVQ